MARAYRHYGTSTAARSAHGDVRRHSHIPRSTYPLRRVRQTDNRTIDKHPSLPHSVLSRPDAAALAELAPRLAALACLARSAHLAALGPARLATLARCARPAVLGQAWAPPPCATSPQRTAPDRHHVSPKSANVRSSPAAAAVVFKLHRAAIAKRQVGALAPRRAARARSVLWGVARVLAHPHPRAASVDRGR